MLLLVAVKEVRGLLLLQPPLSPSRPHCGLQSSKLSLLFSTPPSTTTTLLSSSSLPPLETETSASSSKSSSKSESLSSRKRLGKSSFLYKQEQQEQRGGLEEEEDVATSEELRQMAEQHCGKKIGSASYKKAWTRWLYVAVESIRNDLGDRVLMLNSNDNIDAAENSDNSDDVKEAFEKLFFNLGVAADVGKMPSFEDKPARTGYALEFFCRARSLAEFLLETSNVNTPNTNNNDDDDDDNKYPEFWSRSLRNEECPLLASTLSSSSMSPTNNEKSSTTYEIVSLGGGPGFDFVGVALAATFSSYTTTPTTGASRVEDAPPADVVDDIKKNIHVTIMDYEEGWSDLVSAMDLSTKKLLSTSNTTSTGALPSMSCDWGGKCDITKSILHDPANANCLRLLRGEGESQSCQDHDDEAAATTAPSAAAKLWICQYCVAENAELLRQSDYIFLKELVREMPVGTCVLLTEVVPRLWPEMVRMLQTENLLKDVDVGFCKGYNGKQFMLRKRSKSRTSSSVGIVNNAVKSTDVDDPFESLDDRTRDQLEHFERLASYHERKVDAGWERQGRKVNGSVYHEEQLRQRRSSISEQAQ